MNKTQWTNNLIRLGLMPMTKKRKGSVYTANVAPEQEYRLEGNYFFYDLTDFLNKYLHFFLHNMA